MQMQRRPEFSFPGSPARGLDRARPPVNLVPPRPREEEEVRWLQASRQASPDHTSSGTPSPQLWSQHHRPYPASAGSSPSRAQAIAGYRREMLDLVRGLPESAYELSLRDIVEHRLPESPSSPPLPAPATPPPPPSASASAAAARGREPASADEPAAAKQSGEEGSKKQGRKQSAAIRKQRSRSLERSVSLDTGLLIKFFLPLSLGRGGRKKVSPKPDAAAKDAKKKKQGTKSKDNAKQDDERWTKSDFSDAGSSSRTSSTGSSNSSTASIRNGHGNGASNPKAPVRSRSRKRNGCYAFFRANKSKNGVTQD